MRTVLITGGSGYIGSNLVNKLLKKKFKIIIVDKLKNKKYLRLTKKVNFFKLNILNKKKFLKIFSENKIDFVIHLAASTSISSSMKNPKQFYKNNVECTENVVNACNNFNIKKLIFTSSCAVYGNPKREIVNEKSTLKPVSFYGFTKLEGEKVIKQKISKKKFIIMRLFNVAGSEKKKSGQIYNNGQFIKTIINNYLKKKMRVKIFGNKHHTDDGYCHRDFVNVNDITNFIIKMITSKKINTNIINCGSGFGTSIIQIIKILEKFIGLKFKIQLKKKRKGEIGSIVSNKNIFNNKIQEKEYINKIIRQSLIWEEYLIKKKNG